MRRWRGWLGATAALVMLACASTTPPSPVVKTTPEAPARKAPLDRPGAQHLFDRLAYGPRPGDVDLLLSQGAQAWLDRQLDPASIGDRAGEAALEPYRAALASPHELVRDFARDDSMDEDEPRAPKLRRLARQVDGRRLIATLELAELARHIASERQVKEVMVDFWTNHFNVFAKKGVVRIFAGDYVERVIRPHALGRFEDLLQATARHPAMLLYLDNAKSVAPPEMRNPRKRARRGLNENYARELLELHTLGVDGGYTQKDVIEVARILTGYSVSRPAEGELGFVFRERQHDRAEKTVLGEHFAAGGGEEEGRRLLALLARHPATARHLAHKLCQRFVADTPPPGCVGSVEKAYKGSGGDIRELVRAVVRSPDFWDARHRGNKLKSPLEFLASAARGLGAVPDGELGLARSSAGLGQPLLLQAVPTGYPEAAEDWVNSGAVLARMNFAVALATGKVLGLPVDLERVLGTKAATEELISAANAQLLGGRASARTLETLRTELGALDDADDRRQLAVALALGGPDFQRQ